MKPWEKYREADGPWTKYSKPKEREVYDPTEGMGTGEKLLAGVGSGMVGAARTTANLLLPDALTPDWASDKAISQQDEIDAPLLRTGAGLAGNILGATALTAPVGGAAGLGVKALTAGSRVARAAPVLSRALGSTPGIAAVEGGVQGAMLSRPENRLSSTLLGAGLSGGLSGGAKLLGKVGKAITPTKSASTVELQKRMLGAGIDEADTFIPISQAADDGLWKQAYEGLVANLPGGSRIRGQLGNATQSFRQLVSAEAAPLIADASGTSVRTVPLGQILQHGDDVQAGLKNLDSLWDQAFEPARQLSGIAIPKNWSIPKALEKFLDDAGYTIPKGRVSGQELLDLKEAANMAIQKLSRDRILTLPARREIEKFIKTQINSRIMGSLKRVANLKSKGLISKVEADLYEKNLRRYSSWIQLRAAARAAKGKSKFTPAQVTNAATKSSPRGIFGEGGPLQDIGKLGEDSLRDFPSREGIFQLAAAMSLLGGGVTGGVTSDNPVLGTLGGAATGLGSLYFGAKFAGSPAAQKFLLGDYSNKQKIMAAALRKGGRAGRRMLITEMERQNNEQE